MTNQRTIISALHPWRYSDSYTEIFMTVWFEEFGDYSVPFCASPFDCECHGKELWIRAMAGEFGPIEVVSGTLNRPDENKLITVEPRRLLSHGLS